MAQVGAYDIANDSMPPTYEIVDDPAVPNVVVATPAGYAAVSTNQIARAEAAVAAQGAAVAVTVPSGYDVVSAGQIARAEAATQEAVSGRAVCALCTWLFVVLGRAGVGRNVCVHACGGLLVLHAAPPNTSLHAPLVHKVTLSAIPSSAAFHGWLPHHKPV